MENKDNTLFEIDIDKISSDYDLKKLIYRLMSQIEDLVKENMGLKDTIQRLRDEIARLKGYSPKPKINPNNPSEDQGSSSNFQSGIELKERKPPIKEKKLGKILVHNHQVVRYKGELPDDARHKGYRSVVIQGIKIEPYNTEYRLERFYSKSTGKLYEAEIPKHLSDGYDPTLKSWILTWYYDYRITENKIEQKLKDIGIKISAGYISNILIKDKDKFHQEKNKIIEAGISSTTYQHIDDTGARVMGANQYFSVLCNEYYSAFFINPRKSRLTVLKILSQGQELYYTINGATTECLKQKNVPEHIRRAIDGTVWPSGMSKPEFINTLERIYGRIKARYRDIILEVAAVAWYQEQNLSEKIKILLSDAAKQFGGITELNALCWVHEDRHYAKLRPIFKAHKDLVEEFRHKIRDYYKELKAYKSNPDKKEKKRLNEVFDELFSVRTGYDTLDECIARTMERKSGLLVVLDHPEVPLHNNPAELAVREYIIKRKISIQTRSEEGTRSWETFLSIKDTCRKLGVNFRKYLYDRLSGEYNLPSLAEMIGKTSTVCCPCGHPP